MEAEAITRKRRIDPKLVAAGWTVAPYQPAQSSSPPTATAVEEWPTAAGPADYALADQGGLRGVVEAKKVTIGPQGVLTQAERYARGITSGSLIRGEFGVPFLYSTNGEQIYFHDVRREQNRSRLVSAFHTPAALTEMLSRDSDAELAALANARVNQRLRDYQIEANQAVERAIAEGKRKMLVTMATGTGKTLTTVNQVHRLMKSGVARRVLFLVDRRVLAAQTVREFASFEAEPGLKFDKIYPVYSQAFRREDLGDDAPFDANVMPASLLTSPQLGDAFVYVTTIQRMSMNLFGGERALKIADEEIDAAVEQLDIPIHAFDLIVADECHRGYSAKDRAIWRDTLDHFDAIKVGLTATPAAHTVAYFENLVYRYEYERAVREGYLVDYDVVKISSDIRINGVFLREGEQVDQVDPETGTKQLDLLEDERSFDASEVERKVTAPDSNRKILHELKRYADEFETQHGRFPKTLIFAVNDLPHISHADQLVAMAREIFGRGEDFVAKITGRVDRPLQHIREFRNRPKPRIVVTVDLLTTGVDIPDLEFLVFLRPVKSRILFEQMLGRGTRLGGDQARDKDRFVVFDCFDGSLMAYFKNTTGITAEPAESDNKSNAQIIEEIWQNKDRDYNVRRLVKRLQRIAKSMNGEAYQLFAAFIPDGDLGDWASKLQTLLRTSFMPVMKILRDPVFQDLLEHYPRGGRTFVVASSAVDEVSSGWLIRGATGREYRPEDYLMAFTEFVRDEGEKLDAISVLLKRPKSWNPETLTNLRDALSRAPEHFTEANLERAFRAKYGKALVDIISMVKHAALDTAPLLTAHERVSAAIANVTAGRQLTDEQQRWMNYIEQHLIENLSIDREDFNLIPILSARGGWGRANRVFDHQLPELIERLNEELVAA
ncbi:DEAD/DEAH box helicase family protein [Actinomadura sp. ATCC 31491]|uniref:DEAD/DEAH box helicase family protein n=1 Tax=Actinomadura luzonensis TaxID=2805427 RepID=A0ABT0FLY9_9ACTN|nr:type I restriction-modification enzyme R subunit C-terminal domain-containing protein [Actinomadura luzonensis]MCK2213349.1 DEAD/DEAH box helicase family protein [Actinomadura luzonensis]